MSIGKKITELTLPILLIGGFLGAVQDIISPLIKLGVWAGIFFILSGFLLTIIPTESRIGTFIKKSTAHWKRPLVFSSFIIGVIVIAAASMTLKNTNGGGKGVLADNIEAFGVIQQELLGLAKETNMVVKDTNKVVKDTNVVVKDTNKVVKETDIVVKETNLIVKDNIEISKTIKTDTVEIKQDTKAIKETTASIQEQGNKTLKNTETIVANTTKTPYEQLVVKGLQANDPLSFMKVALTYGEVEFKSTIRLFKTTGFNINRQIKMPEPVLALGDRLDDNQKADAFFTPIDSDIISLLVALNVDISRLEFIADLFEIDLVSHRSPIAQKYARQANARGMPWDRILGFYTHPQISMAVGEDLAESLISYKLARDNNLHTRRGNYSLLHYAAAFGHSKLMSELIARDLDINALTESGYTPVAIAIERDRHDIARLLLNKGADPFTNENFSIQVILLKTLHEIRRSNSTGEPKPATINQNRYVLFLQEILKSTSGLSRIMLEDVKRIYESHYLYLYNRARDPENLFDSFGVEAKEVKTYIAFLETFE